jgi:phage shock protein C
MNCSACNNPMSPGARFCSNCGSAVIGQPVIPVQARLYRPRYGRALGGVCAGIAQHMGWDVALVRLVVVLVAFFGCGTPILAYLIAWIVIPNEPYFFAAPAPATTQPTA